MKVDVPDEDAWRRKRADEREGAPTEPWYMRQARAGLASGGVAPSRTRTDVRPLVASGDAGGAKQPSPPVADTPKPSRHEPLVRPVEAAANRGGVARGAAILAGLLFAAAAGWQVRDLLDPPLRPVADAVRPVTTPAAVPAGPLAARCDDPLVAERLRGLVAAEVGVEGAGAGWSARVGSAAVTVASPRVTVVNADGSRFCGTTLSIVPPVPTAAPIDAAVTYTVGAPGGGRDEVTALQGVVPLVRRLVDLGRSPPAVVEPANRQATTPPPVANAPSRTSGVSRIKPAASPRQSPTPRAAQEKPAPPKSPPAAAPAAAEPTSSAARIAASPSVSNVCDDAVSRAEAIVCATPSLTRLDRELNATLDRVEAGDTKLAKKVADGQRRFLARRDRCTTEACIADRYSDRLDDIAETEARLRKEADRIRSLPPCRGFEVYRPVRPCRIGG